MEGLSAPLSPEELDKFASVLTDWFYGDDSGMRQHLVGEGLPELEVDAMLSRWRPFIAVIGTALAPAPQESMRDQIRLVVRDFLRNGDNLIKFPGPWKGTKDGE